MDEVKVVVAHSERATLRVGDVFLKVDADQARIDVEVEAMSLAPGPIPHVLWRRPPVLARRTPGDDAREPRRAVDRVAGGVGCGGRHHPEAAPGASATPAGPGRPEHRRPGGGTRRRVRVARDERRSFR
ncbi:hypothetical protein ABUL04_10485 [Micromonospora harpali]|uniref:Carbon storage regulator, CsrA n=1 Tax=Micromonospora harpali TaxID=1490225 RepID=A0ABW1HGE2_9ACTN